MQLLYGLFRNRELGALLMDQLERVPVTSDLLLVTITQQRPAENNRAYAGLIHSDTLDPVGRNRALNQGVLTQDLESLRRLLREKLLLSPRLAKVGEIP